MSKPTLDEILAKLSVSSHNSDYLDGKNELEAKQQITRLVAEIIGEDYHFTNPTFENSHAMNLRNNEHHRQRQRAKERGVEL